MPDEALLAANNLRHNVLTPAVCDPKTDLTALAEQDFRTSLEE